MGIANSNLLVINYDKTEIQEFRSKLVLLRDVDSIIESNFEYAIENCKKYVPDAIIIFAKEQNDKCLEICKNIRFDSLLKNTPVIFILDSFDEEFVLSGFDAGMSDYLCKPFKDSEILMRVIWSLQKSEILRELEKKQAILADLKVIDSETGVYTQEFIPAVFSNDVITAQKYKIPLALIAVKPDKIYEGKISNKILVNIIQSSTRNTDILGVSQSGTILAILQKTKVDGVNTVYERIKNKVEPGFTISMGACELGADMSFDQLNSLALNALSSAIDQQNSIVIADISKKNEGMHDESIKDILSSDKNYKFFKQAFLKKIDNLVNPVVSEAKEKLQRKYGEQAFIDYNITQEGCIFSIKDRINNNEVTLKIIDPGLSKIIIDVIYVNTGVHSNIKSKIDLPDFNEQYLNNILDNISAQFDKFLLKNTL